MDFGCSLQLSLADRRGWCHPGDGNFHFKLEQFAFYKDHKYHNTDVYGARGNAFLVPLPVSTNTRRFSIVSLSSGHKEQMQEARNKARAHAQLWLQNFNHAIQRVVTTIHTFPPIVYVFHALLKALIPLLRWSTENS